MQPQDNERQSSLAHSRYQDTVNLLRYLKKRGTHNSI